MTIPVLVNGAFGKMGQYTVKAIKACDALQLVAETGSQDDLSQAIQKSSAQVVVDFTRASDAYNNVKTIIDANVHPVIGTSGFVAEQVEELKQLCATKKLGGIIAPNFSIGAVLMMKYAEDAAKYFADAEIIEMHHQQKQDAPSGTAIKTAEMIAAAKTASSDKASSHEIIPGARGGHYQDIPIHSVRLPGFVAHQQVLFGKTGETLTIRHDSIDREAFMPGVCLACERVGSLNRLVYGLEHLL